MQHARAKKELIDHEDDEPMYVDEASNETISKEDFNKMASGEKAEQFGKASNALTLSGSEQDAADLSASPKPKKPSRSADGEANVGTSLKRKRVRTIDHREDDESTEIDAAEPNSRGASDATSKKTTKQAKKGRRIKLSFDD